MLFRSVSQSRYKARARARARASRGVNTKIASFIPQDIDPTEESVSKWLESNADVFGLQTETPHRPTGPSVAIWI